MGLLSAMEGEMLREGRAWPYGFTDAMIGFLIHEDFRELREERGPRWRLPPGVATIPCSKRSPCEPILLVLLGEHDDYDRLLLETVEYLAARCSGVTKYVIFHAATWNAMAWVSHREAIVHSGATPILKLVGSEPIHLNPHC